MIDAPRIIETPLQFTAAIHLTIPRSEIRSVMGPGLEELSAALEAQDIVPAGPWFTHHFKMPPGLFDFEICMPVAHPVAAAGRVKPGLLPAAKVARTIYRGSYQGLPAAWREFDSWIAAENHVSAPDLIERYIGNQITELNRPLLSS